MFLFLDYCKIKIKQELRMKKKNLEKLKGDAIITTSKSEPVVKIIFSTNLTVFISKFIPNNPIIIKNQALCPL